MHALASLDKSACEHLLTFSETWSRFVTRKGRSSLYLSIGLPVIGISPYCDDTGYALGSMFNIEITLYLHNSRVTGPYQLGNSSVIVRFYDANLVNDKFLMGLKEDVHCLESHTRAK